MTWISNLVAWCRKSVRQDLAAVEERVGQVEQTIEETILDVVKSLPDELSSALERVSELEKTIATLSGSILALEKVYQSFQDGVDASEVKEAIDAVEDVIDAVGDVVEEVVDVFDGDDEGSKEVKSAEQVEKAE